MSINKSWSIDDRRLNFQFGDQAGWIIKNGKRTQLVKNPTYTGITPRFWGSCDAICGPDEWTLWGLPNCGKGEPMQIGPRRPRRGARPIPRRTGGCGPMVATSAPIDELLDRALRFLDGGADRGALPRPGLGTDPLRHQPHPPERARARRDAPGSGDRSRPDRRGQHEPARRRRHPRRRRARHRHRRALGAEPARRSPAGA